MPVVLTEDDHDEFVKDSHVLLDFSATWCGPCKRMKPFFDNAEVKIRNEGFAVKFATIDVDDESDLAVKYKISCMPTLIFVVNGKIIAEHEGAMNEEQIIEFVLDCQEKVLGNNLTEKKLDSTSNNMHKVEIVFNIDHSVPFKYKIINEDGHNVKKGSSKSNQITIYLSRNRLYQILIDHDYTTIFKTNDYSNNDHDNCSNHSNDDDSVPDVIDNVVVVNDRTTIATIFCFSQLLNNDARIAKHTKICRLNVAYEMMSNFVRNGQLADTISTPPNAFETNSLKLFNFLSNMLNDTVKNQTNVFNLKSITGQENTLRAIYHIARNPFSNISQLFQYGSTVPQPLKYIPTINNINEIGQMALSIKINSSGAVNYLPGGPAFIVFDKRQRVWISLNTTQGTAESNTFAMVLKPNAHPIEFSPVFPVLGGAYGVAYDKFKDRVILGSFGWGSNNIAYNPWEGSISVFNAKNGVAISPPNGYTNKLHRVQGITVDNQGNYWMCSWGSNDALGTLESKFTDINNHNSSIVVYLNGDPENAIEYLINLGSSGNSPNYGPFSIVHDSDDNIFVSIGGSNKNNVTIPSAVIKLKLKADKTGIEKLKEYISPNGYNFYKGIAVNSKNEIYVASFLENSVIKFSNNLELLYSYYENKSGPWGVSVDSNDTVWVANFLAGYPTITTPSTVTATTPSPSTADFGINEIVDNGSALIKIGKFILPSGGDPVRLETGRPILDENGEKIYIPLMRLTCAVNDIAGNLYAANNWKPSIVQDVIGGNPGGDGIVVFVGVGAPK